VMLFITFWVINQGSSLDLKSNRPVGWLNSQPIPIRTRLLLLPMDETSPRPPTLPDPSARAPTSDALIPLLPPPPETVLPESLHARVQHVVLSPPACVVGSLITRVAKQISVRLEPLLTATHISRRQDQARCMQ
jgi:hypothetical protein